MRKGQRHTEETIAKMQKPKSKQHKINLSKALSGKKRKPLSKKTKQKISKAHFGKESSFKGRTYKEIYGDMAEIEKKKRARIGDKHHAWKGNIRGYPPEFNEALKETIRKRDNYQCQMPGCFVKQITRAHDIHHIDYDKDNNIPLNLITLCKNCHMKTTNSNNEYWKEFFIMVNIGRFVIYYRKLGVRWCRLSKQYNLTIPELKRLRCLYIASLEKQEIVK